ncbi:MAG: DNA replication and repair protein RecF [Acidobacteria bacterium]|nr:DNA replication and repair protein RecF [Acidobacteriota bacterium]MCA1608078.1 DNA replication and repair protein RecF [Acidobacteriota bacterium]
MLLESIEVSKFRNLSGLIPLESGLNILLGDNGQGKTNWLEAVYLLATTKSFRTSRLEEAIKFDGDLAIVRGRVRQSEEIRHDLQVALQANTKSLSVNGKKATLRSYLGELHAVVFNSDALEIVRGHPESRRRFLDDAIVSLSPPFVQTFSDFGRVIKQKNALLQTVRDQEMPLDKTAEILTPWNEQLSALATRIHHGRTRIVERLNEMLQKRLFASEEISIRYVSSIEGKGDLSDYENLIVERLKLRVQAEVIAGHSLVGPHRDDLEILFDNRELRKFGSAGQQRSALLVLQLANIAVYHARLGEYPLFLLDDIDAELDYKRIGQLLEFLEGKTQTFATTSKESFVEKFGSRARVFGINDGMAEDA